MIKTTKILISIAVIALIPIAVKADGGVTFSVEIEKPEKEINLPSQEAIIFWDGENEILSLSTGITARELSDLAWVIPIPSNIKPEVEEEKIEIFSQIPYFFADIKIKREVSPITFLPFLLPLILLFILLRKKRSLKNLILGIFFIGIITFLISITFVSLKGARQKTEVAPIQVIETKKVGIYDVMTLKATDATFMVDWLNQQGYKISKENVPILQGYCNQPNFYFIVNKISHETLNQKDLLEGIATPLKIKFQPERPFYPLRMSSINGGQTIVDVYFIAENPVRDESGNLLIKKSRDIRNISNLVRFSHNEEAINAIENFLSQYDFDVSKSYIVTWLNYEGSLENLQKDAYFKFDSVVCENLPEERVGVTQDKCYEMLANSMIDLSFCDKISDQSKKDWCYIGLNNLFKDLLLCEKMSCEKISRPESGWGGRSCQRHIDECYENLAKQAKYTFPPCDEKTTPFERNFCYYWTAREKNNPSLCEKITDKQWKKVCYEYSLPLSETEKPEEVISSFEECVAKGYPILATYPRQCKTPDGKIFFENIKENKYCREMAEIINDLIEKLNHCELKSECSVLEMMEDANFPRYYTAVNTNADLTELNEKIEEYRTKCHPYFPCTICRDFFADKIKEEVDCMENKCVITYGFIKNGYFVDTSGWKTYKNEEMGFEYKYPPGGPAISVERRADISFEKCMEPSLLRPTGFKKAINGVDFYYYTNYPEDFGGYCGMHSGCQYAYAYIAFYKNHCYELKFYTYSPSEEVLKIFNQMLSTFRFLE